MRLLSLLGVVLAGCTSSTASSSHTAGPRLVASLERGPCLGKCPVYLVEGFDDGTVRFIGRQNVEQVGTFTAKVSPIALAELKQAFDNAHFSSIKNAIDSRVSDASMVVVSDGTKTVRHAAQDEQVPAQLTALEATIERVLGTAQWLAAPER